MMRGMCCENHENPPCLPHVFLFFVVLLPFPTALLGDLGGSVPTGLYAATIILTALASLTVWQYAVRAGLTDPEATARWSRAKTYGGLAVVLAFVPSLGLVFVSASLAQLSWIVVLPFGIAADRLEARQRRAA